VSQKIPVDFKYTTGCVWGAIAILIWGILTGVLH
jgi:hypothetical protein